MRQIVVAVPAWGPWFVDFFLGPGLASHRAALAALEEEFGGTTSVRYVVRTDDPARVARALGNHYDLTLLKPPSASNLIYRPMSETHQAAIESAREGDRVVMLVADAILSREAFAATERRFREGFKAILCPGTRTRLSRVLRRRPPPLAARQLRAWCLRHRHQMTAACFFGQGRARHPSEVFFAENGGVVLRAFHVHPFAIVKDRPLPFDGTLDIDLIDNYRPEEIHFVTDADEMALAEVSAPEKSNGDADWKLDVGQIVAWALRGARPLHWWNFRHRVIMAGDPGSVTSDQTVADEVLRLCPYPAAISAPV